MISRQRAIFTQCHLCVAPDKASHWIRETENCQGYSCALYHLRPVRGKRGNPTEAHKIPHHLKRWREEIASSVGCSILLNVETALETEISDHASTNTPTTRTPLNLCSTLTGEEGTK